jgi:hypothetical protein
MSWRTRFERYVARIDELRNAYNIFDGKSQAKGSIDALRRWNIQKSGSKMNMDSPVKSVMSRVGGVRDL